MSQYVRLTMSATQRLRSLCDKEVSELKHFRVENIWECARQCKKGSRILAHPRIGKGLARISPTVAARKCETLFAIV